MINNNLHKLVLTSLNSGGESMSIVEQLMAEKQNLEIQKKELQLTRSPFSDKVDKQLL